MPGRIVPPAGRISKTVGRNFNWIWYVGAAAWFFNAAISMHRGWLRAGLVNAAISAGFLAAGIFFNRMSRPNNRNPQR
jgi:hypothetical protein